MIPALILLAALCALGLVLWLLHRRDVRRGASTELHGPKVVDPPAGNNLEEGACCGMHITCERDSLLAGISEKIEYFDDEELDAYAGRSPESYTPEEADEFNEVLMTLRPEDVPGWARSITLRGLQLPSDVRDALLIIVNDQRAARNG